MHVLCRCRHYGEPRKRAKGIRSNQHYFALACDAQVYVSFDTKLQKLVVKKVALEHSHRIGPTVSAHYPCSRRLTDDEREEVKELLKLRPKSKLIKQHITEKYKKSVTMKDLHNIRGSIRKDYKLGRNDAQMLLDSISDKLEKDREANGGIVVDDKDQLAVLYYIISHRIWVNCFSIFQKLSCWMVLIMSIL